MLILSAACGGDTDPIIGDECGSAGECPEGYVCEPTTNRCVLTGAHDPAEPIDASPDADAALDTVIDSHPSALAASATARFTFSSPTSPGATFACSVDGGTVTPCVSPHDLTVGEGGHTFTVAAVDGGGPVDETPATFSWTVDLTAPDTSVNGPSGTVSTSDASFDLMATEPGTFECALDAAAFAVCTTPHALMGLPPGTHVFNVRAVDRAGNRDSQPAEARWTIDVSGPSVMLDGVPAEGDVTGARTARFSFSSEPGASLFCSLDGSAFAACTSPASLTVGGGPHRFAVRATDAAGNQGPAATRTWTVDTEGPAITVAGVPADRAVTADPNGRFDLSFVDSAETNGGSFECAVDGGALTLCTSPFTVRFSGDRQHRFAARGRDRHGNAGPLVERTFRLDTTPPAVDLGGTPTNGTFTTAGMTNFTWSFDPAEPASTMFECSVDGGAWRTCANASYADGAHTFSTRGRDAAGNVGAAETVSWMLDTRRPTATITSANPANGSLSRDSTWDLFFSSNETSVTYECLFDGTRLESPCIAGTHTMTSDGLKTVVVRAIDRAGNVGDWSPRVSYTLDTRGPTITITERPRSHEGPRPWRVSWTTTETATFRCWYMGNPIACTPGPGRSGTASGMEGRAINHFTVRSTDGLGNTYEISLQWAVN